MGTLFKILEAQWSSSHITNEIMARHSIQNCWKTSKGAREKRHFMNEKQIHLTLEQHRFELCRSTYTWIIFNKYTYNTLNVFSHLYDFLYNIFSLAYFILRAQYIIHTTYKYMLSDYLLVRLLVSSRLAVVKFGGVIHYKQIFYCTGGWQP